MPKTILLHRFWCNLSCFVTKRIFGNSRIVFYLHCGECNNVGLSIALVYSCNSIIRQELPMWMEKLSAGVLRVLTPIGPRYIRPSFLQRLYLVWIFRYFHTLPQQVLSSRQQRLIDRLCTSQEFVSLLSNGFDEAPVLGTVERLQPVIVDDLATATYAVEVTERSRYADQQ